MRGRVSPALYTDLVSVCVFSYLSNSSRMSCGVLMTIVRFANQGGGMRIISPLCYSGPRKPDIRIPAKAMNSANAVWGRSAKTASESIRYSDSADWLACKLWMEWDLFVCATESANTLEVRLYSRCLFFRFTEPEETTDSGARTRLS